MKQQSDPKESLFQLLIVIFSFFIDILVYNGQIRQLLKLFIQEIEACAKSILQIGSEQSVGYLLTVFENHIVVKDS